MKIHRIFAIIYRHGIIFKHSFYRLSDVFYWPAFDLLLWGITSSYIRSFSSNVPQIVLIIVSGVIFWMIVSRGQNDISVSLLEELWNKNLINLFVSPMRFSEWILGIVIWGFMKLFFAFSFSAILAFFLYKFNLFSLGFYFLPFIVLLLMTSWWVGFFVNSIILRFGNKVGVIAWGAIMVLSPFSAIYYPVSILPFWAQKIALAIPTSYVFEGSREILTTGHLSLDKIYISFALNIVYLAVSIAMMKMSFNKLLEKGLAKIY